MNKYWFYIGMSILLLLLVAACKSVEKDSAGRPVGDPTGRVLNTALSCTDHCTGYAAGGNGWCFCDAPCQENGNCCLDFKTACPELTG